MYEILLQTDDRRDSEGHLSERDPEGIIRGFGDTESQGCGSAS